MNYEVLPYRFQLAPWLYYMESIDYYSPMPSFILNPKLKTMIEYIRDHWAYESDPRFFRTSAFILLTGCRISEIPSIMQGETPLGRVVHLYAKKQRRQRVLEFSQKAAERIGWNNLPHKVLTLTEKEYNRRFKRYFNTLKQIGRDLNILSGSHILRHIFVSTLRDVCRWKTQDIMNLMAWENKDLVLDYTKILI